MIADALLTMVVQRSIVQVLLRDGIEVIVNRACAAYDESPQYNRNGFSFGLP
jgi:hypothetical protein